MKSTQRASTLQLQQEAFNGQKYASGRPGTPACPTKPTLGHALQRKGCPERVSVGRRPFQVTVIQSKRGSQAPHDSVWLQSPCSFMNPLVSSMEAEPTGLGSTELAPHDRQFHTEEAAGREDRQSEDSSCQDPWVLHLQIQPTMDENIQEKTVPVPRHYPLTSTAKHLFTWHRPCIRD